MGTNPACFEGERRPVEQVSWFDAIEFCNRLSDRQGLRRCYSGSGGGIVCDWEAGGYRLPTEAEWEFACRAGSPTAFSAGPCLDPFGPDAVLESVGWYIENAKSLTHDVAEKERNAWGLHDAHGNVWEWCWDWYGSYTVPAQIDPLGSQWGTARVVRGGSWFSPPKYCRSAFRSRYSPELRHNFLGFRVVRGG
jgi:formylglycine-generating enzyme required for sulfatase activity